MESIIDRVINEIVWRLTSSGRSTRGARAEQPQAKVSPPQQQQQVAPPPIAQPQPSAPAAPEPAEMALELEQELQRAVTEARQELDAAQVIVAELRESADGFAERIAAMSQRLDSLHTSFDSPEAQSQAAPAEPPLAATPPQSPPAQQAPPPQPPAPVAEPQPSPLAAEVPQPQPEPQWMPPTPQDPGQFVAEQAVADPTRVVSLSVASLPNLTVVSVIEAALLRIPGIREVALRQLQGHKAIIDVRLDEGTSLITGLRKSLPVAFDVTESSNHSLEISLSYAQAQTQPTNGGGGAGTALA